MAERDDDLSRRYRALAREEPPAALDAAILAASRRAVGARPGGVRRWAGPVSIAAVLMLGVGVTLRMQQERPGIETAAPISEYQAPAPAESYKEPPSQARPQKPAPATDALAKRNVAPTAKLSRDSTVSAPRSEAFTATPPQAAPEPSRRDAPRELAAAGAPAAASTAPSFERPATPAAAAPPPPVAAQVAAAPPPAPAQLRAKREMSSAAGEARMADADIEPRARELERIAKLRSEGRHAEADKALEEFRRVHPDYRIPEAVWERVRPR